MAVHLVIIGNGFDLAHGLETSYSHFFKKLIDDRFDDFFFFKDIIGSMTTDYSSINNYKKLLPHIKKGKRIGLLGRQYSDDLKYYWNQISKGYTTDRKLVFKDPLIAELIFDFAANKWCDIEARYFALLTTRDENSPFKQNPKLLNDKFRLLKEHLEEYLKEEEIKAKKLNSYKDFFETINSEHTLLLNFNYTHTIENLYSKETSNCRHIHMHGEVDNKDNPLIFGYAALHEESRELLSRKDGEYLRNIKKHLYKRTANEHILSEYLSRYNAINISILGHSCGISDNLILNQILNHKNIESFNPSIRVFYYDEYESYRETLVNIDRIMNNDERFRALLVNFLDSDRMPQYSDEKRDDDFKNFLKDV